MNFSATNAEKPLKNLYFLLTRKKDMNAHLAGFQIPVGSCPLFRAALPVPAAA
jgi:hypothetical protein